MQLYAFGMYTCTGAGERFAVEITVDQKSCGAAILSLFRKRIGGGASARGGRSVAAKQRRLIKFSRTIGAI